MPFLPVFFPRQASARHVLQSSQTTPYTRDPLLQERVNAFTEALKTTLHAFNFTLVCSRYAERLSSNTFATSFGDHSFLRVQVEGGYFELSNTKGLYRIANYCNLNPSNRHLMRAFVLLLNRHAQAHNIRLSWVVKDQEWVFHPLTESPKAVSSITHFWSKLAA